jgi:glycosyltransferase involved in cell wall biosynthesis
MTPIVSIIMPVYQVEDYIANSIKSVVNQTFSPYEVVLVSDGTKDKSIEIASTILDSAKVNYTSIKQDNRGVSAARNSGIRKSKAKWIVCVDPDDVIAPDFLERLYGVCIKYKTDVGFCNYQLVDYKNIFKKSTIKGEDVEIVQNKILVSYLKRQIRIIAPGLLIKKDFFERNNLWYDESIKYSEDLHFVWRVLLSAKRVAFVKDQLYNYLKRNNSTMTSSEINKVLTGYDGMKKLETKISERGMIKTYILPRWIFAALNASTRMMDYDNFCELAKKMDYKRYIKQLLFFPDLRISILSILLAINLRLFYSLGNSLKWLRR